MHRDIQRKKNERKRIYNYKTGSVRYFFNTEQGMVRACAYWIIQHPDKIAELYSAASSGYRKYRTSGATREESLMKLIMISSLGFRAKTRSDCLVYPGRSGSRYFTLNYDIALSAIQKEGGKTAIDARKVVMWKHRTYFQAISTLQMYAAHFRKLTEGLEGAPDTPGWLITGMMNMRRGIELPDAETAVTATVAVCEREADTEQADYESLLADRDAQIATLNRTITDLTQALEKIQESVETRSVNVPAAPPAPSFGKPISRAKAVLRQSIRSQSATANEEERVQRKGGAARNVFLGDIAKGNFNLKPVAQRKTGPQKKDLESTDKDVKPKAKGLIDALASAMAKRRMDISVRGEAKTLMFQTFAADSIDSYFANDIASFFHPFISDYEPVDSRYQEDSVSKKTTPGCYNSTGAESSPRAIMSDWKCQVSDIFS